MKSIGMISEGWKVVGDSYLLYLIFFHLFYLSHTHAHFFSYVDMAMGTGNGGLWCIEKTKRT